MGRFYYLPYPFYNAMHNCLFVNHINLRVGSVLLGGVGVILFWFPLYHHATRYLKRWGGGGNLFWGTNVIERNCFKILQWINSRSNFSKSIYQPQSLLITCTCPHLSSVSMLSLFYLSKVLQVLIQGYLYWGSGWNI